MSIVTSCGLIQSNSHSIKQFIKAIKQNIKPATGPRAKYLKNNSM